MNIFKWILNIDYWVKYMKIELQVEIVWWVLGLGIKFKMLLMFRKKKKDYK